MTKIYNLTQVGSVIHMIEHPVRKGATVSIRKYNDGTCVLFDGCLTHSLVIASTDTFLNLPLIPCIPPINTYTEEDMKNEISRAFTHGQVNAKMMDAGLERDEVDDYTSFRILSLRPIPESVEVEVIPVGTFTELDEAILYYKPKIENNLIIVKRWIYE